MTELEGYQPVSRIGEVVVNAFGTRALHTHTHPYTHSPPGFKHTATDALPPVCSVDSYEFSVMDEALSHVDMIGNNAKETKDGGPMPNQANQIVEHKPHFHEWATVLPGMICLARKQRNATFRNYVAAETATPVIGAAAGQKLSNERNFYFAGVCRSKTIRPLDDGVGPTVDEFFTLAIGGLVTMLNNSGSEIYGGDVLEWTFYSESVRDNVYASNKRQKSAVRRIGVKVADPMSDKVIGRAMGFAKHGEMFDLLLRGA
jgi:hypothetical protein